MNTWQFTPEEIERTFWKGQDSYMDSHTVYPGIPEPGVCADAARAGRQAIARAAQKKLMEWLIKRGDPYIDNGLVRFELLSKAWRVLLKELGW